MRIPSVTLPGFHNCSCLNMSCLPCLPRWSMGFDGRIGHLSQVCRLCLCLTLLLSKRSTHSPEVLHPSAKFHSMNIWRKSRSQEQCNRMLQANLHHPSPIMHSALIRCGTAHDRPLVATPFLESVASLETGPKHHPIAFHRTCNSCFLDPATIQDGEWVTSQLY